MLQVSAFNDPGHDSLYVLKLGDSTILGNLNVTGNITTTQLTAEERVFSPYLVIKGDGDPAGAAINRIVGTTAGLEISSIQELVLNTGVGGIVRIGSTGVPAGLNVTGNIWSGGTLVCLADGTNCISGTNQGNVTSVFGRTGIVVAESGDYDFTQISGTLQIDKGGTGATTANDAIIALGAAKADNCPPGQVVVNTTTTGVQCMNVGTGDGSVTQIDQGTGIILSPTTITTTGTISFNTSWGDARYYTQSSADSNFVAIGGSTMTGFLILSGNPTDNLHATTKQYVDTVVSGNISAIDGYSGWNISDGTTSTLISSGELMTILGGTGITSSETSGTITISTTATTCGANQYSYWNGSHWNCRSDEDTIYSAGDGISLSGTSFTVEGGTGLTQQSSGLAFDPTWGDARYYTQSSADSNFVAIGGSTMSGFLTLSGNPTNNLHATTKQYVDTVVSGNISEVDGSKWTTGTGDNIYRLIGDVGIGTYEPTAKLHVVGTVNITNNTFFGGNVTLSHNPLSDLQAATKQYVDTEIVTALGEFDGSNWNKTNGDIYRPTGLVGIGTDTPQKLLHLNQPSNGSILLIQRNSTTLGDFTGINFAVTSSAGVFGDEHQKAAIFFERTDTDGRGSLHLATSNTVGTSNVGLSEARVTITQTGEVGIGTTTPTETLTINGTLSVSDNAEMKLIRFSANDSLGMYANETDIIIGDISAFI